MLLDQRGTEREVRFLRKQLRRPLRKQGTRHQDQHGQAHYVMVEPDQDEDSFSAGEAVLLVAEAGPNFRVIRNDNPALSA